jgi:hypothetical protein
LHPVYRRIWYSEIELGIQRRCCRHADRIHGPKHSTSWLAWQCAPSIHNT